MELFLHYSPSNENRRRLMAAIEETKAWATGEPHRWETLHSTLAYLGEVDEARVPELCKIIEEVAASHKALPTEGDHIMLSHDMSVYNAWGLIYIWKKSPEMQAVYEEITSKIKDAGFWFDDHGATYTPHSTMYMKYYPNEPEEEKKPEYPQLYDTFDTIVLSQVTVIDGHVAYYPLFWAKFEG